MPEGRLLPALADVASWHDCVAPFLLFVPCPLLVSFLVPCWGGLPSCSLPPGGWPAHSMIGLKVCDDGAPRSCVPGLLAPSFPVCPVAFLPFCLELWCVLSSPLDLVAIAHLNARNHVCAFFQSTDYRLAHNVAHDGVCASSCAVMVCMFQHRVLM